MFVNALISVNWTGTGVDAAALARRLCTEEAQLSLAHIHAEVPLSPDPLVMALRKFELRHSMRALKGSAFATNIEPTLSVGAPSVSEGLSGLVSMIGADLLVLGPVDWQSPLGVEVTDWVTHRPLSAPTAIAIANEGFAADASALRQVGVVYDNSEASDRCLTAARHLADWLGSRVKVFEASPTEVGILGPRRNAIATQRLAEFSSRVDLLVASPRDRALHQRAQSPLLLINHPVPTPAPAAFGATAAARPTGTARAL
jgi:hypothetical protein